MRIFILRILKGLSSSNTVMFRRLKVKTLLSKSKLVIAELVMTDLNLSGALKRNPKVMDEILGMQMLGKKPAKQLNDIYDNWVYADYLFGRGEYWNSVSLRKETLLEIYRQQGVDSESHVPPILSSSFTISIGHLGFALAHILGQINGVLPSKERIGLVGSAIGNKDALQYLSKQIPLFFTKTSNPTNTLLFSHLVESIQILKSRVGFLETFEFYEELYKSKSRSDYVKPVPTSSVLSDYHEKCRTVLKKEKVDPDSSIAVVHVRDNGNKKELRNSSSANFVSAIKLLLSKGFQVVSIGENTTFGESSVDERIKFSRDLNSRNDDNLDFYLLTNSQLYLGTHSGPSIYPYLFDIPALITNITSPSRVALSSPSTLYTYKRLHSRIKKQEIPLHEYLKSRFSFGGDYQRSQLENAGLSVNENTPEEILCALEELLFRSKQGPIDDSEVDEQVREFQNNADAVSFGRFANSFVEKEF